LIAVAIEISQALNKYRLEARHVVVEFDWPKCQVMVYVQIESSANFHGKGSCGIHETLRQLCITDSNRGARYGEAARVMRCAEEGFTKRRHASQPHIDARAEHISKQRLVNVQVMYVSVVNSIEAAYRGEPMVKVEGDLAQSAIRRKCGNIDPGVNACK